MALPEILACSAAFAALCSGLVVWILERREKKYGLAGSRLSDAFPAAALTLVLVYLSTLVVLLRWPGRGAAYCLLVMALLAAYGLRRERIYKRLAATSRGPRQGCARLP